MEGANTPAHFPQPYHTMKNFLLLLLFTLTSATIFGQAVSWELSAEPGNQAFNNASFEGANFDNGFLTRGAGLDASNGTGSMNSSAWFEDATPTTLDQAIDNEDYYEFRIESINCFFFNPTTINIVLRSSATGPNTATLRCSSDGFTANIGTITVTTTSTAFTFSESISPNSQAVTYRLYGYGGAAGGGNPSAGGTMRIGTSVVSNTNDLEVFATTTLLTVATQANITVSDGDFVPSTAFAANVPGATIDWTRTLESFGLGATSGTGNVPSFTAFNASGAPIVSTFTVNATLGNCESQDMVFTITVNPDPCTITVDFFGNPSACDDNGTPNDPSDDFFTQNIHASFFNRPSTGSLQIVPGGDQIGSYSIPVNQIIGNSHLFTAVKLKADGTPSIVQMNFTDEPGCIDADTGPTVQSCSNAPSSCEIIGFSFANIGQCNDNGTPGDDSDDFFLVDIDVLYSNTHTSANLRSAGGDIVNVLSADVPTGTNLTHTFPAAKVRANGQITTIPFIIRAIIPPHLEFCSLTGTGPAVNSCSNSGPTCAIIALEFQDIGPCDDNGTPNDPTDDFYIADLLVSFENPPATGLLQVTGADVVNPFAATIANVLAIGSPFGFQNKKYRADGQPTSFLVEFSDAPGCELSFSTVDGVGPCSYPAPVLTCPSAAAVSCANEVPAANPSSVSETHSCPGAVTITHLSDLNSNTLCVNRFTVTRTYQGVDQCGNTSTCAQTITINDQTPPTVTCPGPVTVSCASQVPAIDLNVLGVTDNCAGLIGISRTFNGEAISNQLCVNRFTLTRTYQGGDACGNTATCIQVITVNDQTKPTMTCPGNVTVSCASQVPAANIASVTGVGDNCGGTVTITNFPSDAISNQSCTNRFTILRSYFAVDVCGNSNNCNQSITVNDQTKPTMTCPGNLTVSCANQVPAANIALVTGVGDNCGGSVTITNFPADAISNQTCANRFTIQRSYFAVDACGNSNNCIQTITVNDQTGPIITCPAPQTISCAEQVPAPNPALVTGSDNCGGSITPSFFSNTISNQTCANRFTLTRQYRAADACGNTSSCTQIITVNDQTPPVFTFVPANVTVDCYLIPGVEIATASDNCTSGASVAYLGEVSVPGICPVWKILTRTWRATDVCGNSATASQVITVTDFNAPQFLVQPKNKVVECGPNNAAEFQAFIDNRGGAVVQDCAQITYTQEDSPVQNNYFDCGNTFHKNIRFFATDECGNVSFRDASFTVVDQTPPVFSTPPQNIDIECDASADQGENAFYDWLDNNAGLVVEDNCGEVELEKVEVSTLAGCGNTWRKTYEFRAKDECGNFSKMTATFSVVDHTPPTLACPANDNVFLACVEDVPAADPTAISAQDCNGVNITLTDTWTNGTGCPGWPMTVAYRYAATDACGNQAICERAFYVEETDAPTLVCPDTIKLICVNDIPGPAQLFGYIKAQLAGNCAGGFTSISLLGDSGQPQNGATHRTYSFKAKNHCGKVTSACSVTFYATGSCNQLCTASQGSWGDPNGTVGGMSTTDAITQLIQVYGPVKAGGGNHKVSASDAACVQELLFGSGTIGYLPTGNFTCPLPASLSNTDGSLNNQLAANAIALQLNIWYNLEFNNRNLGIQNLHNLPPCLVEFPLLKNMAQNSTVQDLLDLSNQYLQGFIGNQTADLPAMLNAGLDNLNHFRVDCGLNAPCERPGHGRSMDMGDSPVLGINLAPNPAFDAVTLSFESAAAGKAEVQITDGRALVLERHFEATSGLNKLAISLTTVPAGVYYLTVRSAEGLKTARLVKLKN